jgi:UDP:flavonoid glycosyltransferase YjiC (YdhE family)
LRISKVFRGIYAPKFCVTETPPPEKLTTEKLAAAMKEATPDREMQSIARGIGEQIRPQNGAGKALAII